MAVSPACPVCGVGSCACGGPTTVRAVDQFRQADPMSGKQVIFDRGDGNRFRIDLNRVDWNKQRYPRGYVVNASAVLATAEPQAVLAADDVEADEDSSAASTPRDLTIRELRELAKENNVSLPSGGTRRTIIDALRAGGVEVPEVEENGVV